MKNYWCEKCNSRWQDENKPERCPVCFENHDIRPTMSKEEAKKLGIYES